MTRFRISLCVLAVLIAFSILNTCLVNKKCRKYISMLTEIKALCNDDNENAAKNTVDDLKKLWDKESHTLNLLINNDDVIEISTGISKIESLVDDCSDERDSEIDSVICIIEELRYSETPSIYTIF